MQSEVGEGHPYALGVRQGFVMSFDICLSY